MTPQQQTILAMLRNGQVTYRHAAENGVPKLTSRICELRKVGHKIAHVMHNGVLPTGKKIQFAEYTLLGEQRNYKRGQRKPEKITSREYTCEVGEDVMHEGKRVRVCEILEEGSEVGMRKSYISCNTYHRDGALLKMCYVSPGCEWSRL